MLSIILTADYELFGNGSGDLAACVLQPTSTMLSVAERYRTRVTLFVDVCEVWAFEEAENAGIDVGHAYPATAVSDQLKAAVRRGHDVQLHVHPQWLGGRWDEASKAWTLRLDRWRTGRLPESTLEGDGVTIDALIGRGQKWLEALLWPVDYTYRCRAFRAGAWSIQPEGAVLRGLSKYGFCYETTVAPGAARDDGLSYFDFSTAPLHASSWRISESVTRMEDGGSLVEVPIFTRRLGRLENIVSKLRRRRRQRPPGCCGAPAQGQPRQHRVRKAFELLFTSGRVEMFDFCALTAKDMERMVDHAHRRYAKHDTHPLVAIGHPKNFDAPHELDAFLAWCEQRSDVSLDSISRPSFWRTAHGQAHLIES